jgi:transposase-like protein
LRWLDRKPNWLNKNNGSSSRDDINSQYGVVFIPLRCPKCRSKKVKCYGSHVPVRYHVCKACGYNFKSIEQDFEK